MNIIDDSKVYINESWGGIVGSGGLLIPLTPCCLASASGPANAPVCFGCGTVVAPVFRQSVRVTDYFATRDLAAMLAAMQDVPARQRHIDLAAALVGREGGRQRHPSLSGRWAA